MGRMLQIGVAVAMVAVTLQYMGVTPPIPGLGFLSPRLSGSGIGGGGINTAKLLSDLNSDIALSQPSGGSSSGHGGGDHEGSAERVQRAASAALSVMYLATMPGLREQVKSASGVMDSLVRRVLTADLEESKQLLLKQQKQQQQRQPELLSVGIMALAKLAAGDESLQAAMLGRTAGGGGFQGKVSAGGIKVLPEGQLLTRLGEVMQSGVPTWQAASAVLLRTVAGERVRHPSVTAWVAARTDGLIDAGMGLVETGAYLNSTDALSAGTQLLELVAAAPEGRQQLAATGAQPVVTQVLLTYAGTNTSSTVVAGAARVLQQLVAVGSGAAGGVPASVVREASVKSKAVNNMSSSGLVAPLVREVRLGNRASLGPSLALLLDLMRSDDDSNDGGHEAVGAGLLSLCAQLLFKVEKGDEEARSKCSSIFHHTLAHCCKAAAAPTPAAAEPAIDSSDHQPYTETPEGRGLLAADMLRLMRDTTYPDLHNAVLEACRDVAPARAAAEALVEAGAVPQIVHILNHNISQSHEQGADPDDTAWILQSQRSAAAIIALLGLQPKLRERVVKDGAISGLAMSLEIHTGHPGLMAQVRITAAAALVPFLGEEDGRYIELAVSAGVLEPLVKMYYSRSSLEQQAASRVMELLGRDPSVAAMYERVGIQLSKFRE